VWKWAEDVVLTNPIPSTDEDLIIYKTQAGDPTQCIPVSMRTISESTLRNLTYSATKVKASMQINLGNLASGNVFTFFETTQVEKNNMNACAMASGERIVSLRPLTRAFRKTSTIGNDTYLISVQDSFSSSSTDYIDYLSYMYRFFRGGMRYKIEGMGGDRMTSGLVQNDVSNSDVPNVPEAISVTSPSHITYPNLNPFHEISLPFYSQYRKLPISIQDDLMRIFVEVDNRGSSTYNVLRAGNDDFTFGWLMGTPQLITAGAGITWTSFKKTADLSGTTWFVNVPGPDGKPCYGSASNIVSDLALRSSVDEQYQKMIQERRKLQNKNLRRSLRSIDGEDEVDES
jgi:hypothetical protein